MFRVTGIVLFASVMLLTSPALGDLVVQYDPANATVSPDLVASNSSPLITPELPSAGDGLNALASSFWRWQNWDEGTSFDSAVAANNTWTWGLSVDPAAGQALDLTTLDFALDRSPGGPDQLEIRASAEGMEYSILSISSIDATTGNFTGVDLTPLPEIQPGQSVLFTLAAWDAVNELTHLSLKDIAGAGTNSSLIVNGNFTTAAVPEAGPVLLGTLVTSLVALSYARRRWANAQRLA